ncbi:PREDICTED: tctex1 domain-containing protein 1-like [Dufourea novaeangliae]|uniref:tctex1 domain-containing protein 1-like n=1 Tax=Dufourea novaeangliae TaxID=178035 RepID=UPI000767C10D|nr:PREDICTED: tctex1 domain-containing protein 1-like [Dufourea novaeangliae]
MPLLLDVNDKNQDNEREAPKYQNSYRLEAYNPFKVDAVDKIVKMTMINKLEDISYDAAVCPEVCKSVAGYIREKIKRLNFDRYKIIINVTIIEKTGQSVQSSVGFLWDPEKDNYSTFTYEARTFHAYCCVFGLYHE